MAIIDTHTHYDLKRFKKSKREAILDEIENSNIDFMINATTSHFSMSNMREKLSQYEKIMFSVGKHPVYAAKDIFDNPTQKAEIEQMVKETRTVAIGETGIDTYRCKDACEIANQVRWFRYFIQLSKANIKPLILHIRGKGADKKALKILKEYQGDLQGVIHCFNGSYGLFKKYCKLGDFYFGIGGSITYDDNKKLKKAIKKMPLDKIVLETDCPFLKPQDYPGKINSSLSLPYVISAIAEIKETAYEEVEKTAYQNALTLFKLSAQKVI